MLVTQHNKVTIFAANFQAIAAFFLYFFWCVQPHGILRITPSDCGGHTSMHHVQCQIN